MLPLPFERSAGKSWLNPKFDSHVLEEQYLISIFPQIRLRFRYVTNFFFLIFAIPYLLYFLFPYQNQMVETENTETVKGKKLCKLSID